MYLHVIYVYIYIYTHTRSNYVVRGACAPLMDSECHSMKTLVNAIDYACRLGEGPGNKNISLGSVLKLLLVSHIAVVFAALLVVAVAKSHCRTRTDARATDNHGLMESIS